MPHGSATGSLPILAVALVTTALSTLTAGAAGQALGVRHPVLDHDLDPARAAEVEASVRTVMALSPEAMLAFLPVELEQRMLKMELAYKGAASEDDIIQTVFECVARGGGFDVIVVDQKP